MTSADLVRESQDPSTGAARLAELAQIDHGLWPAIAVHPAAYPALLDWLGQQGDPTVNAVLALRSASSAAAPTSPVPPPPAPAVEPAQTAHAAQAPAPPVEAPTAYAAPTQSFASSGGTQAPSSLTMTSSDNKNFWRLGGMLAIVLVLIGGVAFGATKVLGDDGDDKDKASSSQTVEAPELTEAPTVGAPTTGSEGNSDSPSAAFCEKFKEAQSAIRGNASSTSSSETAKTIAGIFREIENMAPLEVKSDIGVMAEYFGAMSDPSTLDTSKLSERVEAFTEAGKRISTYYASNCM